MNTRVAGRYYLIPLLYIGLIGALLYFQFARQIPFHFKIGEIDISGNRAAGNDNQSDIASIRVQSEGLVFSFSRTTPVGVLLANGTSESAFVQTYRAQPDDLSIGFTTGLTIDIKATGTDAGAFSLIPRFPGDVQASSVSFPFSLTRNARVDAAAGAPALSVTTPAQGQSPASTQMLTLPPSSDIRLPDHVLTITSDDGTFAPTLYASAAAPAQNPLVFWLEENGLLPDEASYDQTVSGYLDKTWAGWTGDRYDPSTGTWQMHDGTQGFSEPIAAAVLAESLRRSSYPTAYVAIQQAAALHPQDLTVLTMPYFGNVQSATQQEHGADSQLLQRMQALNGQSDNALFSVPNVIPFVLDHGSGDLQSGVLQQLRSARQDDANAATQLGLLDAYLTAEGFGISAQQYQKDAFHIIDTTILPALFRTKGGFYLQTDQTSADIRLGLSAGMLLVRASALTADQALAGVGRELVASALSLSDSDGYLPATLTIASDTITGASGVIAPEDIYAEIEPDAYYPRERSLAGRGADGVWLWSASRIDAVDASDAGLTLKVAFPAGYTESLAIHGISSVSAVKLYGTPWASDPQFEQYAAGWAYDPSSQTMFVRLRHQDEDATIAITY